MTQPLDIFAPGIFQDRVVLVTGGGRGIGRAVALAFAKLGAHCIIAGRHIETLEETAEMARAFGVRALPVAMSIRETEHVDGLVEQALAEFSQIDFLINNAGGQFPARPLDISDNGWRSVVDLNLNGTWNMSNRVGRHMVERGFGAIVNIVHIYSYDRGAPDFTHSGAARAGVVNMSKSLAFHWARHNVTVNCVAPGTIETEGVREEEFAASDKEDYEALATAAVPAQRLGQADETAAMCVYLCSPAGRYISGTDLVVDGANYLANWVPIIDPA